MKKLYSLALGLLAGLGATAQVTVGGTNYETLQAGVAAAEEGATVTINEDVTISDRIEFTKALTVEAVGGAKIVVNKVPKSLLLVKANVTFKNIVYDGADVAANASAVEVASGTAVFENVKFVNVNQTGNRTVTVKSYTTLDNVSFENCTYADGIYSVYVGANDRLTLKGTGEYNVYIEKGYRIRVDAFTGKATIYLEPAKYAAGYLVATGGSVANFALGNAPEGYSLVEKDGNLVLFYAQDVAKIEETGVGYTSFADAMAAAEAGQTIVLLEDLTLTTRETWSTSVTIKGATPDVRIIRDFTNNILFIPKKPITFENLIIDGNNKANNKNEMEAGDNNLTFRNVKIVNSATAQSIVYAKSNRSLTLDGVTVENCGEARFYMADNSHAILSGDNSIPATAWSGTGNVVEVSGELTGSEPILLQPDGYNAGVVMVKNCTDASKFSLGAADWHLEAQDGNLVLAEGTTTGIEDVVTDENAPVEYYNLQGMRVENPSNGIFIRRQGGKTVKVAL